jgi:arylsulfatase A-like enzyme
MDFQVGRVLQALVDSGVSDQTIVVFTSDNGGERFSDTWPFSGRKTELLEGGLRIPCLVRWPGRVRPGAQVDQVAISMDWLPTLVAAAGSSPDPAYPSDGIDLTSALTGQAPASPRKLFWRYKSNAQRAARDGDFKILKIRDNTFLFDVVADPLERANLKQRRRDVYDRMVAEWNAWNAAMLPENPKSGAFGFDAANLADHYGARSVPQDAVDNGPWPEPKVPTPPASARPQPG